MKYKLIIFDYDGTLVDTYNFHASTIFDVLSSSGSTKTIEQLKKCMGVSMKKILEEMMPPELRTRGAKDLSEFYKNIPDKYWNEASVIEGAVDVIKKLRKEGYKTALVTNSHHNLVDASLAHFGLTEYFDWVIAADDRTHGKEERLELLLKLSGMKLDECLYVGDTATDMVDCKNARIDGCLVDNEHSWIRLYNTLPEDFTIDMKVSDLREIPGLLGAG